MGEGGALPRQPKVRYVGDSLCHDVISHYDIQNGLFMASPVLACCLHSITTSVIFEVLEW